MRKNIKTYKLQFTLLEKLCRNFADELSSLLDVETLFLENFYYPCMFSALLGRCLFLTYTH